jgi:cyclic pyranopterin phosphate synthase
MVDVSGKEASERTATASAVVRMSRPAFEAVVSGRARKGDAASVAELAGLMGAKRTSDLIPLCHPIALTGISVTATPDEALPGVRILATAGTTGQTGVEMEALTAVSVAALTLYDMLKSIDRSMTIERIRLEAKSGGASGNFQNQE